MKYAKRNKNRKQQNKNQQEQEQTRPRTMQNYFFLIEMKKHKIKIYDLTLEPKL